MDESANVISSSGDEESGQVKVVQAVDRSHNDDDASPSGKDQGNKSSKRQQEQHSKEISAYDEELGFCGSIWVQCKAQRRFVYAMLFSFLTLGIMFWLFSGQ